MRTLKYYIGIPAFILVFLIQTTLLWRVPIFGYSPNLLLCLVIVFSFIYEGYYGLLLAVIFGVLLDVATSQYFGTQTIGFVLAFGVCAFFRSIFNHEKLLPDMLMAVIATPICAFLTWIVYHLTGSPISISYTIQSLPVLMISQAILVGILHLIFVRSVIRHRRDRRRERYIL